MQVFNPVWPGYDPMAEYEVLDAAIVYNEMLAYPYFLEKGVFMNLDIPDAHSPSVLWSGLRFRNEAIIRAVNLDDSMGTFTVEPWPGHVFELTAPPEGKTYRLERPGLNPVLEEDKETINKRLHKTKKRATKR